jgi:hypothetical protein
MEEKTISYPGSEPRSSGLAVGSLNYCTIGSVEINQTKNNNEFPHNYTNLPNVDSNKPI